MKTPCPNRSAKPATGCSPSQVMPSSPFYQTDADTFEDSWRAEMAALSIGNSTWSSARRSLWPKYARSLVPSMPSQHGVQPRGNTFGRKKQPFPLRVSSLESYRSAVQNQLIGHSSGQVPSQVTWDLYHQTYMYDVTTSSEESARIIFAQLEWTDPVLFSGGELALESRETPGQPRVWKAILKIQTASSGTDTEIMNMWSLMNFEEELRSTTYSDGLIDTHVSLKSKDPAWPYVRSPFGSPRI